MKATNCPFANKIDACNSDLIVAITEVIAGNIIPTENHLILPEDLFGLNPKQLDIYETVGKKDGSPPLLVPGICTGEEQGEGSWARWWRQW
jgi:hypothetical protein